MKARTEYPNDAKEVFMACGTCSHTFAHLLNREFRHPDQTAERAMNLMAGGIMNQGYQCGMLWGASLAVGAEAYRKYGDLDLAVTSAVNATQHLIASFVDQTDTVNCREIIGIDLTSKIGMAKFMLKVTAQGRKNSHCFNLAEQWAPEAIEAGHKGVGDNPEAPEKPLSCASEVVRQMGGTEEEMAMVAGFAGGLGLYGGGCGALSAAIWKRMLDWCRENPEKDPPYFNNKTANNMLKAFKAETGGIMGCPEICGHKFSDLTEHTDFIDKGGCKDLIALLAGMVDV